MTHLVTLNLRAIIFSDIKNKPMWLTYIFMGPILLMYLYPKTASSIWCFLGPALTILLKIFIPQ